MVGCGEEPSYTLRWKLVGDLAEPDASPDLTEVNQCSSVGVSKVEVVTLLGSVSGLTAMADLDEADFVDIREYPCRPEAFVTNGAVDGPTLEPGDYTVAVFGQRRSGEWWPCSEEEPECYATALAELTVAEDASSPAALSVVLLEPPQCDDGIDNDKDGRVDDRDPACLLPEAANPGGLESAEKGLTLFQLSTSFLTSEAIEPRHVQVDAIALEIVNTLDASDTRTYRVNTSNFDLSEWPFRLPLISDGFDEGTYELRATALDVYKEIDDETEKLVEIVNPLSDAIPRTVAATQVLEFQVEPDQPAFVVGEFEFTDEHFFEPILAPITFDALLQTSAALNCALGGYLGGNDGMVERLWVRVRDASGQPVDPLGVGFMVDDVVDEGNGYASFPCPPKLVTSMDLTWGSYSVEVDARIGGDVCFAAGEQPLAPGGGESIILERVLIGDEPLPNCVECVTSLDCRDITHACEKGVCLPK